ncbi:unnamed protein product, partial [Owenia fusiformis]
MIKKMILVISVVCFTLTCVECVISKKYCGCPRKLTLKDAFCPIPRECTEIRGCPDGTICCTTCRDTSLKHCLKPTNPIKPGACPTFGKRDVSREKRCGQPCANDCDCKGAQ